MAVEVKGVRDGVEISWDPMVESGPPEEKPPDQPDGFPTHPIFLPPYVDNTLPGDQPKPDHELPGDQPEVSHPIYLPPYIDNSLPVPISPEHPIVLPPDVEDGLTDEQKEKLKAFLTGNLPPFDPPDYVAPTGGKQIAVQVFAQGQEGDWSNTAVQPNDGLALLSYPKGFKGESYVEVRGLDGSLVDSGTIEVG